MSDEKRRFGWSTTAGRFSTWPLPLPLARVELWCFWFSAVVRSPVPCGARRARNNGLATTGIFGFLAILTLITTIFAKSPATYGKEDDAVDPGRSGIHTIA